MRRLLGMALLLACASGGCGNDKNGQVRPGFDAGASPAGSCNFPAMSLCDEYAPADANTATAGSCTGAGGEWSTGKCPLPERSGICVERPAATRTYSYGANAATMLASECPNAFTEIKDTSGMGGYDEPMPPPDAGMPPEEDAG